MKILRVKLPDNLKEPFRSLHPGFEIFFYPNLNNKTIEPIGLAGLNGCGKSNLLELLSEIYYYLDSLQLEFPTTAVIEDKGFGFEIDYALPLTFDRSFITLDSEAGFAVDENYFVVRVIKAVDGSPSYSITSIKHYLNERETKKEKENKEAIANSKPPVWVSVKADDKNISSLLPKKIFAYTSGHNEQLSNCYYKMQFHYFNDYKNRLKQGYSFFTDSSRLFFSDNNSNASIFVSNYLLANSEALTELNDVVKTKDIHSFRITIRYEDLSGKNSKEVKFNQELERKIKLLKNCSTSCLEKGTGAKRVLTIDYLVTPATKKAFALAFGSTPFELYKTFYELEMQNFHTVSEDVLEMATNGPKWLNISDELPKQDPNKLVFRLERIFITKHGVDKPIKYKGLSDGEHQFLQIIGMILMVEENGCLFLLDEPDTHYNPLWRSRLVSTINKIIKYKTTTNEEKQRMQEIMITTHSPFVLSDLKKQNVYIFKKPHNKIQFNSCHFETYGASASIILDEVFGKEDSISEMARDELKAMIENITTMDQLRSAVNRLNSQFGESVEKFDLFSKLRNIKEQLENKK
ncbi:MAG: restriction system-associated AAA family ATPase [Bacteroidia bacterium]